MLCGYTIAWDQGVADIYSKIVDSKQRGYFIDKLEPNMEFVISLRAFNNVGDGQPVYQQVRTQPEEEEVVAPTLDPAVGVEAVVLTPFTVVLQWADTMLSQNQYNSCTTFSSSSSSRYVNATDVTCLIDSLKPSTVCEFAVKTIRVWRESPYSLVASNNLLVAWPSWPSLASRPPPPSPGSRCSGTMGGSQVS
ncbi:neogenin-like isoform X4 [Eriocheir sinensis]|uniref:neogenin-like isoform X4 n=1 Tax=Eriocheir sinensis TaxID=95602 RepID=UPI0021C98C00|nr:neogenin-like isoform X4 [Eriocheir sinensis]